MSSIEMCLQLETQSISNCSSVVQCLVIDVVHFLINLPNQTKNISEIVESLKLMLARWRFRPNTGIIAAYQIAPI